MLRTTLAILVVLSICKNADLVAQSPTVAPSPAEAKRVPAPAAAPSATPTAQELINSLSSVDLQTAISLLKNHFPKPDAVSETELNRATLQGILARLNNAVLLLPGKAGSEAEPAAPFYSDILENHIGYIRPGSFSSSSLQATDRKLADFSAKKLDALVLDLRASASTDFDSAAEFANRFVAKGKTLFSLRKQGKQERTFTSDRDATYAGLLVLLADQETSGSAEALAAAIHFYDKALIIGETTAGRAVEYSDLPLPSGRILRVAVSECVGGDGRSLYPEGVKPDLPVEMAGVEKRQIFQLSMNKGMVTFVNETERPHLNEAALIAGTNPELETAEQRHVRAEANTLRDAVLQRAVDLVTSLGIYGKH